MGEIRFTHKPPTQNTQWDRRKLEIPAIGAGKLQLSVLSRSGLNEPGRESSPRIVL